MRNPYLERAEASTLSGLPWRPPILVISSCAIHEKISPQDCTPLRRLFSTFAHGWPAVGLLLMRVVAASALLSQTLTKLKAGQAIDIATAVALAATAILLLAGLWTPIAGVLAASIEIWSAFSQLGNIRALMPPENIWTFILVATVSAALALLGPGAWSVDARLFGWRRIEVETGRAKSPKRSTPFGPS
jgi:putative oxidoreductase